MKIAVIGATAGVGKAVVTQALDQGHQVRAFARSPQKLTLVHPALEKLQGDARSLGASASDKTISRADVAAFMLQQLTDTSFHRQTVGIVNQ